MKWRLVWLRDQHPDATIETELVEHVDNVAIFRAEVRIPAGARRRDRVASSAGDFRDYLEKAETKAIGRALRALGYRGAVLSGSRGRAESTAVVTDLGARRREGRRRASPTARLTPARTGGQAWHQADDSSDACNHEFGCRCEALSRGQATQLRDSSAGSPEVPEAAGVSTSRISPMGVGPPRSRCDRRDRRLGNDQHSR